MNEPQLATMGGRIKALRQAMDLTATKAAEKSGISRTQYHGWESDRVEKPDATKLMAFSRLCEVSLDWILGGKGPVPTILAAPSRRAQKSGKAKRKTNGVKSLTDLGDEGSVPELVAAMTAHAEAFDLTPRAMWALPAEILEFSFHSTPGSSILIRVATRQDQSFGLQRDDFALIDTTRTRIDEGGIYVIADADGKAARRVMVDERGGKFHLAVMADDLSRPLEEVNEADITVLGRVMGVFRPM